MSKVETFEEAINKYLKKEDLTRPELYEIAYDFICEEDDTKYAFLEYLEYNGGYAPCGCDCEACHDGRCGQGDCECAYK